MKSLKTISKLFSIIFITSMFMLSPAKRIGLSLKAGYYNICSNDNNFLNNNSSYAFGADYNLVRISGNGKYNCTNAYVNLSADYYKRDDCSYTPVNINILIRNGCFYGFAGAGVVLKDVCYGWNAGIGLDFNLGSVPTFVELKHQNTDNKPNTLAAMIGLRL